MGTKDRQTTNGGNALFDITVSVHLNVLTDYLLRKDGFWFHIRLLVCNLLWIVFACVFQVSLNEHFPELPLYPLPLVTAYLAFSRRPWTGLFCALVCGIVYDSLTFGQLGISSAILGVVAVIVWFLSFGSDGIGRRLWERCLLLGGSSVFIYVACKLGLYFAFPNGEDVLSLVPKHLLEGTLLCSFCLAPLMFSVMDFVEWLLRLNTLPANEISPQNKRMENKPKQINVEKKHKTKRKVENPTDTDKKNIDTREQGEDDDGEQNT